MSTNIRTITETDVDNATVKELRTFAKVLNVSVPRGTVKEDLIDLLLGELNCRNDDGLGPISYNTETLDVVAEEAPKAAVEVVVEEVLEAPETVTLDAEGSTISITVEYLPTKALRYHWSNLGVYAARKVAKDFGLLEKHDSDKYTVTLTTGKSDEDSLVQAADALVTLWTDIHAAFVSWRKTDAEFKALPAMTSSRWASSERYIAERGWLRRTVDSATLGSEDLI